MIANYVCLVKFLMTIGHIMCYNKPMKHKHLGFTVVELIIVIVIVAILASLTSVAYRKTQENARNETRKTDAVMLTGALEEYRAEYGSYPVCSESGGECQNNQIWQILMNEKLIASIPNPGGKAHIDKYYYIYGSSTSYGIYIPLEPSGASSSCKTGKNMNSTWWSSLAACSF